MLEVRTGSRLHFGLFELSEGQPLQYGGLGLMVEEPSLKIRIRPKSGEHCALDDLNQRIGAVLRRRCDLGIGTGPLDAHVELLTPYRIHSGLGFGTQLACAVAVGVELFAGARQSFAQLGGQWQEVMHAIPVDPASATAWLANYSGRGRRSSIGLHGFLHGGFILDSGHAPKSLTEVGEQLDADGGATISQREIATTHLTLPDAWRVVLIIPSDDNRISGLQESNLLQAVSKHANPWRQRMIDLAEACRHQLYGSGDFVGFTSVIDQYTALAGRLFESVQGGIYRGGTIERAVALARNHGLSGVGQSSWGPAVFGFAPDLDAASAIAKRIALDVPDSTWEVLMAKPSRSGSTWRAIESG